MNSKHDPALHPTGADGRFVTRSSKPAGFTLPPAAGSGEAPLVPPSGCGICGEELRGHGMRFGGGHVDNLHYEEPSREQRKKRIAASVARQRAVREQGGPAAPVEPVSEDELVHPSGCLICGGTPAYHGMTSKGGQGFHAWQEPGLPLRKERIKAVAAARKAAVAGGRKGIAYNLPLW